MAIIRRIMVSIVAGVLMANLSVTDVHAQKGKGVPPAKGKNPAGPLPKQPGKGGGPIQINPLDPDGSRAADETINQMRYTRLIHSNTEDPQKPEALLWNVLSDEKFLIRLNLGGPPNGRTSFKLVQSLDGESIVFATVVKIDKKELTYRVMLAAETSYAPKWWRYGDKDAFYSVHQVDFSDLVKNRGVREEEKNRIYVVKQAFWEKLTAKGTGIIRVDRDGKKFEHIGEKLKGELVYADREVRIIRMEAVLPLAIVAAPSIAPDLLYPDAKKIYTISRSHFGDVLAAAEASKAKNVKAIQKTDYERVFVARTKTWQAWAKHKIIKGRGPTEFMFYRGIICGDVLSQDKDLVIFRVAEKFCRFSPHPYIDSESQGHAGVCVLKLDAFVQDALTEPVPGNAPKGLSGPIAPGPGGSVQPPSKFPSKQTDPQPLPEDIVAAWEKAGGQSGWMNIQTSARLPFKSGKTPKRVPEELGRLPAFKFADWKAGIGATLPSPDAAFAVILDNTQQTDIALKELAAYQTLEALSLVKSQVTDAGLKEIAKLDNLTALNLSGTKVTDQGLKSLAGLKRLQDLDIANTQVTDAGLEALAKMGLRSLSFPANARTDLGLKNYVAAVKPFTAFDANGWQVTDAGLKELAGMNLEKLFIGKQHKTDLGFKNYLAAIKPPVTFNLFDTDEWTVSDTVLKELAGVENLQTLQLYRTKVTDAHLKQLIGSKNLKMLQLNNTGITDLGLTAVANLRRLEALDLRDTKVTDAGLEALAGMNLTYLSISPVVKTDLGLKNFLAAVKAPSDLNLDGWLITDDGLQEVAKLKNLKSVQLINTKVTDAGLKQLAGMNLEKLTIDDKIRTDLGFKNYLAAIKPQSKFKFEGWNVTNAALKELANMEGLQTLELQRSNVKDDQLKELPGLKNLQALNLSFTGISDAGLKGVGGCKTLKTLNIATTAVADAGMKELTELKDLQILYLASTKVTDVGVKELARLKNLQTLNLVRTPVTDAGMKELRQALPNCQIVR